MKGSHRLTKTRGSLSDSNDGTGRDYMTLWLFPADNSRLFPGRVCGRGAPSLLTSVFPDEGVQVSDLLSPSVHHRGPFFYPLRKPWLSEGMRQEGVCVWGVSPYFAGRKQTLHSWSETFSNRLGLWGGRAACMFIGPARDNPRFTLGREMEFSMCCFLVPCSCLVTQQPWNLVHCKLSTTPLVVF